MYRCENSQHWVNLCDEPVRRGLASSIDCAGGKSSCRGTLPLYSTSSDSIVLISFPLESVLVSNSDFSLLVIMIAEYVSMCKRGIPRERNDRSKTGRQASFYRPEGPIPASTGRWETSVKPRLRELHRSYGWRIGPAGFSSVAAPLQLRCSP